MNKINKLINELCPNGVEWKELREIATVSGAGVDKKINKNEKDIKLLNFMDIYRNKYIDKSIPTMIVTANDNKITQCNVLKGDIFITPSSEVLNDIGNSAVAIEDLDGVVYSYHIMRLRLKNKNLTTSMFINYVFETNEVQNQINKNAKGITRFGLTKTQWEKILIPIPPLSIQQEIVNILDKFTALDAELQAELEARRKQYEHYRKQLLTFKDNEVEWKTLGEVCIKTSNIKWKDNQNTDYQYIDLSSVSRENHQISDTKTINWINAPSRAQQIVLKDDVLLGTTRPTLKRITLVSNKFHNQICSTGFCVLRADKNIILPNYLYLVLKSEKFFSYVELNQEGGSYPSISDYKVKQYQIPIPSLTVQKRIIKISDIFEEFVNESLPAEIEARRKQCEYYREKLLTFGTAGFQPAE